MGALPATGIVLYDRRKAGVPLSAIRVLVVDDFEPFRRFIASTLQKIPEVQLIGEVSDGLEAVQKAQELHPDLIVLDIGLPTLNGIEAARRIRTLSPESKILFLSQESSVDTVQLALGLGAQGYLVKAHAGSELLPAVEAVLQGNQFVSSGLSGHWFTDVVTQSPDRHCQEARLPSPAPKKGETTRSHEVNFYSDDASFLVGFTRFIEAGVKAGNAVIVLVTESHWKGLLQSLQERGVDTAAAIAQGSLIPLDVAETLSAFMVNDLLDPVRFSKVAVDLVVAAAKGAKAEHPRVTACGECAPTLWAQGRADAAVQVEHLWDEIAKTHHVEILCGYVLKNSQRRPESDVYEKICAEHSSVHSQ